MKRTSLAALVLLIACDATPPHPAASIATATTTREKELTLEDPPYALDSVFKPESHRAVPIPLPADARLVRDPLVAADIDAYAHLGEAVAIDGDVAVAGAPYADIGNRVDAGAAYVFVRGNGRWRKTARILAPAVVSYDRFGSSVAIDGGTIVVGADHHDGRAYDGGIAWVFDAAARPVATLAPRELPERAAFGFSAAIDGDRVAVGAPGAGLVYVFARRGGAWHHEATLEPPPALRAGGFGHSVAIDGDRIVAGANTTSEPLLLGGAAMIFGRANGTWIAEAEVRSPRDEGLARFGTAVAVRGDVALIGASRATVGESTRAGAAWIFERRGNAWTAVAELTNAPHRSDEEFGRALALADGAAVVGSQFGDAAGLNTGGAQLYVLDKGSWIRKGAVLAADRATIHEFAFAIAASETDVIVGAPRRNSAATATGGAYVFSVIR